MNKPNTQLAALGLALVFVSTGVSALPTLTISTSDPTSYTVGVVNPTMTVNFSVGLESGDDVNDTLVQLTNYVAYDPSVLKYQSHTFGNALDDIDGTPVAATKTLSDFDYRNESPPSLPTVSGIGTPDDSTSGFVDGSLLFNMVAQNNNPDFDINNLFGRQQFNNLALLFSITFEVVVDQIGSSAIVFLDGADFDPAIPLTGPDSTGLDTKTYNAGTPSPFYVQTKNSLTVTVNPAPEPASLALLAAGLVGLALRRRRLV